jgi:hypothetical protein
MRRTGLIALVVTSLIMVTAVGVLAWVVGMRNHLAALEEDVRAQRAELERLVAREAAPRRVVEARRRYGEAAGVYNHALRTFPGGVVADLFAFEPADSAGGRP